MDRYPRPGSHVDGSPRPDDFPRPSSSIVRFPPAPPPRPKPFSGSFLAFAVAIGVFLGSLAGIAAYLAFISNDSREGLGAHAEASPATEAPTSETTARRAEIEAEKVKALEHRQRGIDALRDEDFDEAANQFLLALRTTHAPRDVTELLGLAKSLRFQVEAQAARTAPRAPAPPAAVERPSLTRGSARPRSSSRAAKRIEPKAVPTVRQARRTKRVTRKKADQIAVVEPDRTAFEVVEEPEEAKDASSTTSPSPAAPAPEVDLVAASAPKTDEPSPDAATPLPAEEPPKPSVEEASKPRRPDEAVSGPRATQEVHAALRKVMPRVRRCYDRGLASNANLSGRIVTEIRVGPEGQVEDISVKERTLRSPAIVSCIIVALRRLQFPSSELPVRRYSVPLSFKVDE